MKKVTLVLVISVLSGIAFFGGLAFWDYVQQDSAYTTIQSSPKPRSSPITVSRLHRALNHARIEEGVKPLQRSQILDRSAKMKCSNMVQGNYYDHKNPRTGKQGYSYITDLDKSTAYVSENLNAGIFYSAAEVIDNWMVSKPHKKAILDKRYQKTGFAVCKIDRFPGELVIVNHFAQVVQAPAAQVRSSYQQVPQSRYDYTKDLFESETTTCETKENWTGDGLRTTCTSY